VSLYVDPTTGELKNDSGSGIPQGQFHANGETPDASSGGSGDDWARKMAAILGSAAKANQTQNNTVDSRNLQGWNDAGQTQLARDKFALSAPGARAQTSMRASLANNFTPTTIDWGGPGSGRQGQLPVIHSSINHGMENLDPYTRDLNSLVTKDMLAQQRKGGTTGGGADAYLAPQPAMGQTSTADKLMGGGAAAAAIADALGLGKGDKSTIDIQKYVDMFHHRGEYNNGSGDNGDAGGTKGSFDPATGEWIPDGKYDNPGMVPGSTGGYFDPNTGEFIDGEQGTGGEEDGWDGESGGLDGWGE
jgi:hypothetical protein